MTIFEVIHELERVRLHFLLNRFRPDSINVLVTMVGARMEIDVFEDGHLEICRFYGSEGSEGGEELFRQVLDKFEEEEQKWSSVGFESAP